MRDAALTHPRMVPRHSWPEAETRLRTAKAAFTAEALVAHHAVLVRCTAKGASSLDGIASPPPRGVGTTTRRKPSPSAPPEPSREWRASDPLEQAFRRAQAEAKRRHAA